MTQEMTEHDVQKTAVKLLRKAGVRFFAVPNGGMRTKATAAKLWAEGVESGVPDLVIIDPPPSNPYQAGTVIEVKRDKGKASPEQVKWLKQFSDCGWSVHCTKGIAELLKLLVTLGYLAEQEVSPWTLAAAKSSDSTVQAPTKERRSRAAPAPARSKSSPQKKPKRGKVVVG